MLAKEIVSTALLLFGIVIGPALFLLTIIVYGVTRVSAWVREYREQRYLRSLPCGQCRYFANDEFLPCAVNPLQVLTDESRHCDDFARAECHESTNEYRSYLRTLFKPVPKLKTPPSSLEHSP
ncbi:MAG: hypothetical protein AAGC93_02125 [Cyanobacteria bacterium P01_F01_bin.53]